MESTGLEFPRDIYRKLWEHLLPAQQCNEEAAFAFVHPTEESSMFRLVEWYPIMPDGFAYQSSYHLELADKERAKIIKKAHDLDASIVELHSHLSIEKPAFSLSDLHGFEETVPHFLWRLKGKPYFAVVVSRYGFDGLVWFPNSETRVQLQCIRVGEEVFRATGKTLKSL